MGLKRFEVQVEVIESREVTVYAESFEDAIVKGNSLRRDDAREGDLMDWEFRMIGVNRRKEQRMYRD